MINCTRYKLHICSLSTECALGVPDSIPQILRHVTRSPSSAFLASLPYRNVIFFGLKVV